jgi:thiol-disulfide isomerase/thioredoxin
MKKQALIVLALLATLSSIAPAQIPESLPQAETLAAQQGKLILADFFTEWCGYCKKFAREAKADSELIVALQKVVFFPIDAEKGNGAILAKQYKVKGYPTFILLNSSGKVVDHWVGYEKNYFLKSFGDALSDTSVIETKAARFKATPNVKDAVSLANNSSAGGDYKAAIEYYTIAQNIKTDPAKDFTFEIFENTVQGFKTNLYTQDDIIKAADAVLASGGKTPYDVIETAQTMLEIDKQDGKVDMAKPYLEAALNVSKNKSDENLNKARDEIMVDYYLYAKNDTGAAISQKKANMPKDWFKDAGNLNEFAWWCFENRINLQEAEAFARQAVSLAEPGETKAMILDTAAEICFARGNKTDAIKFAKMAVEQAPKNQYYTKQVQKFEGTPSEK